ncbi:MFS general substrate transporter [Trametopsis cervina]|nr:MFS general substrate transporter [Trametopsis cervina]
MHEKKQDYDNAESFTITDAPGANSGLILTAKSPAASGLDGDVAATLQHRGTDDTVDNAAEEPAALATILPMEIVETATTSAVTESKSLHRLRLFTAFYALFLAGWNGGSTGAMIPYIERLHNISYARVAVLFVATFVGYIVAAAATGPLIRRFGFGKTVFAATVVELLGNIIDCSQHNNFNFMCFGFFVVGSAFATQLGLLNSYFATLSKPLMWTGFLHGVYGLGAFASPQVATAMLVRGIPYNLFYTTNVAMNVPLIVLAWFAFSKLEALPRHPTELPGINSGLLRETLKSRAVWSLSIFLMLYVGAEESLGGWIVSYIIEVRKGDPQGASWVASAMYLGLAIGRMVLAPVNMFLGERNAVFIYVFLAIVLECLAWLVPTFASTAVCTALIGLAISTFYAAAIAMGGRLIPRHMHADAFALISAVGQSGSAFWPLIVGVMSTKTGIWVVEPTVVALLGAQGACWWLVPRVGRREE